MFERVGTKKAAQESIGNTVTISLSCSTDITNRNT